MAQHLAKCPICSSESISLRFNGFTNRDSKDGAVWPVYGCKDCGHGFINPQPSRDILNRYYSSSYVAYDETHGAEGDDDSIVSEAIRTGEFRHIPLPAGKRVLDFGCGGGFFLRICARLGADVQGIEPSPHGAKVTGRQGIPVFEGSLEEYLSMSDRQCFDVITSNHVLEHVSNPIRTLAGLRALLAPGGRITIAVPNAASKFAMALGSEWYSVDLPFHLHQFSASSLRVAADRAGLNVCNMGTTSLPSSTRASLQLLLRRKYGLPQIITERLPLLALYSRKLAARHDAQAVGEALLANFT
jgi:2-polyprenyl-3-methyl-5-hydroxy-6-metoxy-1,4-benzoquinol methylase